MFSLCGGCKLLAVPTTPALARSHRRRCFTPLSLLKSLTTGAARLRPIAAAVTTSGADGADGNETTASSGGIRTLSPLQQEQITLYVRALLEWNQRMNLTAVTEESEVMTRHVEDSLAIIPPLRRHYVSRCCREGEGERARSDCGDLNVVDVGTGAGLPGQCVGQNPDFREVFDVAVARAVAEMRTLAEYCLPLVRVGGLFVAAKGYDPQEEVENAQNAVRLLGASIIDLCSVESQGPHGRRTAVTCYKEHATPKKYPRQPGVPSKTPL